MNIENDKFYIILDIDGVLISYLDPKQQFEMSSILALNDIIKQYNADLIMVSGWNGKFKDEKSYKKFLESIGISVNNLYIGNHHDRYNYVLDLVKDGMKKYLCIDDECYGYYERVPNIEYKRILCTNRYRGLDYFDVLQVTKNWVL